MRHWPLLSLCLFAPPLAAQAPDVAALAERFTRMTAVTGFERAALDSVQALLPGARRDRAGNVVVSRGTGTARLIVCPIDEVGYVVGGIRDDGWITLRRVGARAPSALFDQYHEGQRITLWGRKGPLPGVIAVHSTHLQRGRSPNEAPFNVDDAFVDIGASSAAEARAAGAEVLAPVAREKQAQRYGNGLMSGPNAGRRAACAALVGAWLATTEVQGRVVVAFVTEQELGQRGLRTIASAEGPFTSTEIADGLAWDLGVQRLVDDSTLTRRMPALGHVGLNALAVRYKGTPAETVSLDDVRRYSLTMAREIGGGR